MELDNTVMLVDADVARPSVLRMLGIPPGPGLLDLLEGKVDMQSVLLKTNIDKLTILPSGTPHPKATELLASDAMRALLDDMAQRYPDRIIIFDSPPCCSRLKPVSLRLRWDRFCWSFKPKGPCSLMCSMRSRRSRPAPTSVWFSTRSAALPTVVMGTGTGTDGTPSDKTDGVKFRLIGGVQPAFGRLLFPRDLPIAFGDWDAWGSLYAGPWAGGPWVHA